MKKLFQQIKVPIQKLFKTLFQKRPTRSQSDMTIVPRAEHNLTRRNVSEAALKVLYRLKQSGHASHLVGGAVRDLLMGEKPKDFDVVTDASPQTLRRLFLNSRIIGRRFQLVHVCFKNHEVIEVSTFRKGHTPPPKSEAGSKQRDTLHNNLFGEIASDELRRDFTINGLYYNIADFSIRDGVGGMEDLKARRMRTIGDPWVRIQEDPARILRAIRLAAKLDFTLDTPLAQAMERGTPLLLTLSHDRLREELSKCFAPSKEGMRSFEKLRHFKVFEQLFPPFFEKLSEEHWEKVQAFWVATTEARRARMHEGGGRSNALLGFHKSMEDGLNFAALLWIPTMVKPSQEIEESTLERLDAHHAQLWSDQMKRGLQLPKNMQQQMMDIMAMQWGELRPRAHLKVKPKLADHPSLPWALELLKQRSIVEKERRDLRIAHRRWVQRYPEATIEGSRPPERPHRNRCRRRAFRSAALPSSNARSDD